MKRILTTIALILMIAPVASAQEAEKYCVFKDISNLCASSNYGKQVGGHMLRGITNVAMSPIELGRSIFIESRDGEPLVGTFRGIGEGAAYTLLRCGGGLIDVATAIVPNFHNPVYWHPDEPIMFVAQNPAE